MENREYIKTGSQVYWRTLFIIFLGSMAAFGAEYCVQPIIPVIASGFGLKMCIRDRLWKALKKYSKSFTPK